MDVYNIADLKVALDCQSRTMTRAARYLMTDFLGVPDITIHTTAEEIAAIDRPQYAEEIKAYIFEGKQFYSALTDHFNGMMIHSSAVVVDDRAYLFSACSGTGKSTHTGLWLKKFGDTAYILNDDKPAVRVLQDGVYAYGTPWSGKEDISVNKKVKVQAICFIERDLKNWIRPMVEKDKVINMYHASIRKVNKTLAIKLLDIIGQIIKQVPIYQMGCLPNMAAADMSYRVLKEAQL